MCCLYMYGMYRGSPPFSSFPLSLPSLPAPHLPTFPTPSPLFTCTPPPKVPLPLLLFPLLCYHSSLPFCPSPPSPPIPSHPPSRRLPLYHHLPLHPHTSCHFSPPSLPLLFSPSSLSLFPHVPFPSSPYSPFSPHPFLSPSFLFLPCHAHSWPTIW